MAILPAISRCRTSTFKDKEDRMGKKGFSGKKAAPFKKGGGRKTNYPRNAKGQKRK